MQSIFFAYKKASLDAPLLLSVGGVKGGGLGEDMRSNRNALHPPPELETETFRIPYKQRKTITKSLSFFRRKEYNINL